jgi:predicted nucleic acid-binding protein
MFLFDTNVISELFRREPNAGVVTFSEQVKQIYISTISLEEITFGLSAKPIPRISERFEAFLTTQCTVLAVSTEVAKYAGELRGQLRTKGIVRSQADMLLAATAKIHQLTLVTRNTKDFELCNIATINPFS